MVEEHKFYTKFHINTRICVCTVLSSNSNKLYKNVPLKDLSLGFKRIIYPTMWYVEPAS